MSEPVVLLHLPDEADAARRLADALGPRVSAQPVERHRFPDGELKIRLPLPLPPKVLVLRSLHRPNEKLVELLLVAQTARAHGVRALGLVTPYLGYMRQDIAFQPGEAVSQRIVGRFLADLFDAVVTVDPHLHRVATLAEAVPVPYARVVSGAPALADHIARERRGAVLLGPDEESGQWVAQAAARHGMASAVCRKDRTGDRSVAVHLPAGDWAGRAVVILDDMISTGHTVAQAARQLRALGAASVDVAVTHALFADGAEALLKEAGIDRLWSTDCVPHTSSAVSMAPELAEAIRPWLDDDRAA